MANILVVDNDKVLRSTIATALEKAGHKVVESLSGDNAVKLLRKSKCDVDVIVVDLNEYEPDGTNILMTFKDALPDVDVIMMTGYRTIGEAVEAMESGAWDYVVKPPSLERLSLIINRALEKKQLTANLKNLHKQIAAKYKFENIVAGSGKMLHALELARAASTCNSPVLITGESGTGKLLFGNTIHTNSARGRNPFIYVYLSSVDQEATELMLFGSVGGKDTRSVKGLIEQADSGSVFLREITNATPRTQEKLLELLEYKIVSRVGSGKMIYVDTRLIATSSVDVEECARRGGFQEDLFQRLSQRRIHLPPLKERRDDIPLLADHFVRKCSERLGKNIQRLSQESLSLLMAYHWPGNVRELKNAMERAVAVADEGIISPSSLPYPIQMSKS